MNAPNVQKATPLGDYEDEKVKWRPCANNKGTLKSVSSKEVSEIITWC